MGSYLNFLLEASIILLVLYLFYRFVFHHLGYYGINRILLLLIPITAVCIPNIQLPVASHLIADPVITDSDSSFGMAIPLAAAHVNQVNWSHILLSIYGVGSLGYLAYLGFQLINIIRMRNRFPLQHRGNLSYIITEEYGAYSFFNWIFLPSTFENAEEEEFIIQHEKVHVQKRHSFDLLLVELFSVLFWFNPAIHMLRKNVQQNHEFQVDRQLMDKGISLNAYLSSLLCRLGKINIPILINPFSAMTLKSRIKRIGNRQPSGYGLLAYLTWIPLFLVLVFLFSSGMEPSTVPVKVPVDKPDISLAYGYEGKNPVTHKHFTHKGIDYRAELGTPVYASGSGQVVFAEEKGNYGNLIIISHGDEMESWYAHLDEFLVKAGDRVEAGNQIGKIGNTGLSTGPHLHFEIRQNGENLDPSGFLE